MDKIQTLRVRGLLPHIGWNIAKKCYSTTTTEANSQQDCQHDFKWDKNPTSTTYYALDCTGTVQSKIKK